MSQTCAAPVTGRGHGHAVGGPTNGKPGITAGRSRTGWTLALASVGAFMAALDVVVVATALPTLHKQLEASLSDLEWTINAYNLVFACLMLTGAALGDRFGRRRMYVIGLLVFVTGSILAALSASAGLLIAARVVQGAGGAVLVPLTLTLISDAFLPGVGGLYVAVTHSGVTLAAHLAQLVTAELVSGATVAELAPYRPDRFTTATPAPERN